MHEEPSYSTTTFSSKGILSQCERALTAAKNGALSLGIRSTNGVVLASLKKTPSILVDKEQVQKVFKVCDTIIATFSGLSGDFRTALEVAREIADDYFKVYGTYPYVDTFMKEFSKVIQEKTQKGGLRPIGCICLFAGHALIKKDIHPDEEGRPVIVETENYLLQPLLYQIDPSGSIKNSFSFGVGKFYKECSQFLLKRCTAEIEIHDAVMTAALALKEFTETAISEEDMSISIITADSISSYGKDEIKEVLRSI
ncbi:20S proteasome subunit alpha 2 [Nematocida minor]|uniref:20S proteasome subunit alpha 2 n=1 Tax=Nematocida minor TaxID=1912983 RepID=UPI00221F964B|nr:20S proteasome subunit alpha 2 [Nematocida minor]KAI5189857.1 20S proteasome subunit alpha 2 [Nematocida minor]